MALTIGTLVGYLKIDRSQWSRGIDVAQREMSRLGAGVEALGRPGGMVLLAQQAVQLASAIGPAAGALLALPAVLGVVGVAMAAVKVGTQGVGDAMSAMASGDAKAIEETMAKLSPQAREFVKAWDGLKDKFKPMQQAIQNRLFEGLDAGVDGLTKNTLPAFGVGLNATSRELNKLAKEGLAAAGTPMFAGQLETAGTGAAGVLRELHGSIAPIPGAILNVVNTGMPFIRSLAAMAGGAIKTRAEFLGSAEGAEKMRGTIQRGVDTIKTMISIGQSVATVFGAIWSRMSAGGGDVLGTIDRLAARLAEWINSVAGQRALDGFFTRLAEVSQHAATILPQLISAAGWLFDVLNSLPGPVQEFVIQALIWATVLGPLAGKIVAVVNAALTIARIIPVLYSAAKAMVTGTVAAVKWAATHIAAAASTVASWVAAGARTVASLVVIAAGFIAQGAVMAASMAATAAGVVAGWVVMGVQSLIQGARMAAAWVLAMGPVGWIIAAVIGLVALIVANWDTIVAATSAAWQWLSDVVSGAIDWVVSFVKDNWKLLISIILGPLGVIIALVVTHWDKIVGFFRSGVDTALSIFGWLGRLPGMIGGWFASVYQAAVGKLNELIDWVTGLPGRILSALGNLGSMLYESGASMLRGLIDGFMSMVSTVKDKVSGALKQVRDLFPFSPAKDGPFSGKGWVSYSGASIAKALAAGIVSGTGGVLAATKGLMSAAQTSLNPTLNLGLPRAGSMQHPDGAGRALVHIENYHPPKGDDPDAVAAELDWRSRAGG